MDNFRSSLKQAGITAIVYGLGLMVGDLISFTIFRILPMTYLRSLETQLDILLSGIILALFIVAVGGGLGGFVGGWTLPIVGEGKTKYSYAWRSAISMGLLYSPTIFLGLFAISIFGFYYVSTTPASVFMLIFLIIGSLFGLIFGLLFGFLTLGWRGSGWVIIASIVGFGIGGLGLGYGLWAYLISIVNGELGSGSLWMLMLGLLVFGSAGGFFIGFTYDRLAIRASQQEAPFRRSVLTYLGCAGLIIVVIVGLVALRKIGAVARDLLTSRTAGFSTQVYSITTGTHWSDPTNIQETLNIQGNPGTPRINVSESGQLALIWRSTINGEPAIVYLPGEWNDQQQTTLVADPFQVPGDFSASTSPDVAVDQVGSAHIVWRDGIETLYSVCNSNGCEEPQQISNSTPLECANTSGERLSVDELSANIPAIAVNRSNDVMVVWVNESGVLISAIWPADGVPTDGVLDCIQGLSGGTARQVALAGSQTGQFSLVYQKDGSGIFRSDFSNNSWGDHQWIGNGSLPQIYIDQEGGEHYSWCQPDGGVTYHFEGNTEQVTNLPCKSKPVLGMDTDKRIHIVWYSDLVKDIYQIERNMKVIYESIQSDDGWNEPTLVSELDQATQPSISSNPNGVLHLTWLGSDDPYDAISYAFQVQYNCEGYKLSGPALAVYDIARSNEFRVPDTIVPYCQNRYDRLLFTPFPMPEFSNEPAREFGAFDDLNELILNANFEVLLATMEYDEDVNRDSPGFLLAQAITELYHKVKANPENYPRGMTVRVVLGNPPRIDLNSDLWRILGNLRKAGLPAMVNEEIGWKLEVANFEGSMPHSHVKILVIDGKTAISTGFNYQYHHYVESHPSGMGEGTLDIGIQVTGPAAQELIFVFDQLWDGATLRHCDSLDPRNFTWQLTCSDSKAVPDHVPEVLRYYLPGGDSVVFSMLRNESLLLSDNQVRATIENATDSVDVVQAMFAMPPVCMLNFLFDLCTIDQAMPYIDGILQAAENGAEVRLLLKMTPFMGTEALIALEIMADELESFGEFDNIQVRAFPIALHAKTASVDNEFVIIGSQNFHYTAYGEGLAEHNLGVLNPQASADYKRVFDYYWDLAGEEITTR